MAPIRTAFPCNRKNRVRDARPEVSCRVDRVSGRPAQGETDAPNKASNEIWAESCGGARPGDALLKKRAHHQKKHQSCNDFPPPNSPPTPHPPTTTNKPPPPP